MEKIYNFICLELKKHIDMLTETVILQETENFFRRKHKVQKHIEFIETFDNRQILPKFTKKKSS
jgi:hypothetical protein